MQRKAVVDRAASSGSRPTAIPKTTTQTTRSNNRRSIALDDEDGEKGGKIRKEKHSKFQSIIVCLVLLCILTLIVMVKFRHVDKMTSSLRKRAHNRKHVHYSSETAESSQVRLQHQDGVFLPPNSIYSMSVEDLDGQMTSLQKFAGMVTLVVNVACL